jgi:DNA-binding response OmpR family regulator
MPIYDQKNNFTIMVVEDDQDIADALGAILSTQGYTVVNISHIDDEWDAIISKNNPHLILLDIWIGGGDGRELARRLRSGPLTKHIPIIFVSANIATPQIAAELGVEDFIMKPFDVDYLLATVDKHLAAPTA